MARKWTDGDSARLMTLKYNEATEEVNELSKYVAESFTNILTRVKKAESDLSKKLETISLKDLNLENVDNTSDMDKPVSTRQRLALLDATSDKLTSVVAGDDSSIYNPVSIISELSIVNDSLVISTDLGAVKQSVNLSLDGETIVFIFS